MPGEIRWIVLLQKAPKGPFTTQEVESLIAQGLVRRNDVAFQMLEGETKAHTGWKFIWQFAEFERRDEKPAPQKPKPHEPQEDRRQAARAPSTGILPEDIAAIKPDDLLFSTKRDHSHANSHASSRTNGSSAGEGDSPGTSRRFPLGWVVGTVGMAVLLLYYFVISDKLWRNSPSEMSGLSGVAAPPRSPSSAKFSPATTKELPKEIPRAVQKELAGEVNSKPSQPERPPIAREDNPPDRGEIKRGDFIGDHSRDRRDDLDRAPASEEDEEPTIIRKKKRRPVIIEEDDDEDSVSAPPDDEEE